MAAGVSPESICALTFSRKAAGEIYESIVERLCKAATDDAERASTRESMVKEIPGLAAPEEAAAYIGFLRSLLDASHRLRIGTLDSFMLGIVRAFPLELGIPPDCRPMDNEGSEALARRESLLMQIYAPSGSADRQDAATSAMLDVFRQATYGRATKGIARTVEAGIAEHYEEFLRHAGRDWGAQPDLIWPRAARWWEDFGPEERECVFDPGFEEALRAAWIAPRGAALADACLKLAKTAATQTSVSAWPEKLPSVFEQFIAQVSKPELPELVYYKKPFTFPKTCWRPMRAALANLIGVELERTLKKTAGLRALLERYDSLYHEARRRDGGMTFSDVTRLLCNSGHAPSRQQQSDRLYIDYRLDGQLDHWLVDEFQDTSDEQWGAIANLVDEVAQDENRSFFYVGDIKQSIYGWRQGNWRLFDRVRKHLDISPRALNESYRSRKSIVDTVNTIFGGLPMWNPALGREKGPHASAIASFVGEKWPTHISRVDKEGNDGFAALLEYVPEKRGSAANDADDEEDGDGDPAQYRAVAGVLESIPFQRKGLSVAVLVRSNEQGRKCADTLRRQLKSVPVVHEGVGGIVDSPVVTLLLALVRYAAHPADDLARRHLQMSPLAGHGLDASGLSALPRDLLTGIHEDGYAATLRAWGRRLESAGALREDDAFGHQRLREFLAAAEAFDATGSRDPDAFADHIRGCTVKAQAAAGSVRVMTIHQSKGLGFDIVVVPFDPRARGFTDTKNITLIMNDANATTPPADGWLIKTPKREVLPGVNGASLEAYEAARADANFDQLCALYVALTRAKSALFMLVPQLPKDPSSVREADLVRESLECAGDQQEHCGLPLLYQSGEAGWYTRLSDPVSASLPTGSPAGVPAVPFVTGIVRREPSKEHVQGSQFPARWLFQEEAGDVPAFGQALHRLFEGIEWLEDADIDAVVADWRTHSCETAIVLDDVEAQFRNCIRREEVRAALCRPAGAAASEVWREAPFSLVREGRSGMELISGRFDRVVVTRDAAGQALEATVVDYKSNRIDEESALAKTAEGYGAQMHDYADAVARLLQIAPDRVKAVLLFTRIGRAVNVDAINKFP
jgi:ATP-dependent helicase/nuclease subunit A